VVLRGGSSGAAEGVNNSVIEGKHDTSSRICVDINSPFVVQQCTVMSNDVKSTLHLDSDNEVSISNSCVRNINGITSY